MNKQNTVLKLTESAIMIALATILSLVKIVALPFGGSVTAASALPLIIIAYRYGTPWGLLSSGVFGAVQLLLGLKDVQYVTSPLSVVIVVLFDYIIAFGVMGLGGLFKGKFNNQGTEMAVGSAICLVLRYLCHVVSGYAVWGAYAPEGQGPMVYSITYNATYMVPELIITVIAAFVICRSLNFSSLTVTRIANKDAAVKQSVGYTLTKYLAFACFTIAICILLFTVINYGFAAIGKTISQLKINFGFNMIITACSAVVGALATFGAKKLKK